MVSRTKRRSLPPRKKALPPRRVKKYRSWPMFAIRWTNVPKAIGPSGRKRRKLVRHIKSVPIYVDAGYRTTTTIINRGRRTPAIKRRKCGCG